MGTLQDTIERVDRQFRGVEGLRRRPIGALGPLPSPRQEAEVAIFGHNLLEIGPGADQEGMYSGNDVFSSPLVRVPVPFAGNASAMVARAAVNTLDVAVEIELLKNGVGTGLKITIPAATTGTFGPIAGPIAFALGDRISFRTRDLGSSVGSLTLGGMSVRFDPS